MTTALTERETMEELSRVVEREDLHPALEEFIESLDLPADEETAVKGSLKALPDTDLRPVALPKNPPSVMSHSFWV